VERVCFLARVRPERIDEYRARHKDARLAEIFHLD
jgi:L-rhamnose mutarotase